MIGRMRHYVTIEEWDETTKGERGQTVGAWSALYSNVPAEITALNGRELENARQLVPEATYKIRLRYHSGITTQHRITHNEVSYNIGHVNNIDLRNLYLELLCSA